MKDIFIKYQRIIRYFFYSCLATVLDVAISWLLYSPLKLDLAVANTVGVVAGFILSYLLSSGNVFDTKLGFAGFAVFFGTFLLGLGLADLIIIGFDKIFSVHFTKDVSFILSKGMSVVIPFFALYFSRKYLYRTLAERGVGNE